MGYSTKEWISRGDERRRVMMLSLNETYKRWYKELLNQEEWIMREACRRIVIEQWIAHNVTEVSVAIESCRLIRQYAGSIERVLILREERRARAEMLERMPRV